MIRKVEYTDTTIDKNAIAYDAFFHLLLKTISVPVMDKAVEFYSTTPLDKSMRYSAFNDKIISIK